MAVSDQVITDKYAVYCGDCIDVIGQMPEDSVHLSLYSPPFVGLYHYSSSDRDMSNCRSYDEFMEHYEFLVREIARVTVPGRVTAVHCADIHTGRDHLKDLSGDIIRLHERLGFGYAGRYCVWKDPFVVYIRTLAKSLRHRSCVEDSSRCSCASADYLIVMRKQGHNAIPVEHPNGFLDYIGSREPPADLIKFKGWPGKQTENKYSQWVWRQYASAFWDDVRLERVLPFRDSKDPEDERHVHPLQLDVIERAVILWSNPGETVLTPCMGVGSEVYGAVLNGRRGVGVELKPAYFRQAVLNLKEIENGQRYVEPKQRSLFTSMDGAPGDIDGGIHT